MNNDFKILVDFLGGLTIEASGRVLEEPPAEAATKLGRFAQGSMVDEDERHEVCAMLQLHPAWLRYLADRVKQSRVRDMAEEDRERSGLEGGGANAAVDGMRGPKGKGGG